MKNDQFIKLIKETNKDLFSHKFIHNHYKIKLENQTQESINDVAFDEFFELGFATAQCQYAYYTNEMIIKELEKEGCPQQFIDKIKVFWDEFLSKDHIKKCTLCKKHLKLLKTQR